MQSHYQLCFCRDFLITRALIVTPLTEICSSSKDSMHHMGPRTCTAPQCKNLCVSRPTSASAVADHELEEELDEERYADLAHAHEVDAAASPTVSSGTCPLVCL